MSTRKRTRFKKPDYDKYEEPTDRLKELYKRGKKLRTTNYEEFIDDDADQDGDQNRQDVLR